jgi:hypothetical protein
VYTISGVPVLNLISDKSVRSEISCTGQYSLGQTNLQNGISVNSTLSHTDDFEIFTFSVESYALSMLCILIGPDDADFDLYGRLGAEPTEDIYDLRGFDSGDEDVSYDAPVAGIWYFMVHSYSGKGSFNLTVTISYVEELQVGITSNGELEQTYTSDIWRVTVGTNVTAMNILLECEPNDFDVYGRRGEHPTTYTYDWEAGNLGNENFTHENPAKGTWYIMVYPYEGVGSYNITVNFVYGDSGFFEGPVPDFFSTPFGISLTTAIAVGLALVAYYRIRSPRRTDRGITGYEAHLAQRYDSVYYDEPRFCMYCGTQFEPGSDLCQECGARKPQV